VPWKTSAICRAPDQSLFLNDLFSFFAIQPAKQIPRTAKGSADTTPAERGIEFRADMRHLGVGVLQGLLEPRQLQRRESVARHGLRGAVEHRCERIGGLMVHAQVAP